MARFSKFQSWLSLLRHWLVSEPTKKEIHGLGEPTFWSKPGFSLKFSEFGKNAGNLKKWIYPSGRLASKVVNIINLPQEKEFLKYSRPKASCRENRAPPKIPLFQGFRRKLNNNWKIVWTAQSWLFMSLKTYPNFIGFQLVLRAQQPFLVLGTYSPLLGLKSRFSPDRWEGGGQDWTWWVQIHVLACP